MRIMLETIKEIIMDFQESELVDSVPRRLDLRRVARKATVVIVARRAGKSTFLMQVCRTLAEPATRKRELAALADAMGELDLPETVLVTHYGEETVSLDGRTVRIVAAWRFLLELDADAS
jgi:predicted AAA+ superfamily ATPase